MSNKGFQQVRNFKNLSSETSDEIKKDIQQILAYFVQILVNINTFKATLVQKYSRIKVHNAQDLTLLVQCIRKVTVHLGYGM
jgi:hypothetical protein